LVVSGRRMPAAVLLGCTTFSTSTLLRDGISRFAIAALLFFFFLRNKLMGMRGQPQRGLGF
jgi:hypothetical protein